MSESYDGPELADALARARHRIERDTALLRQALEALENGKRVRNCEGGTLFQPPLEDAAISALRERLAEPVHKRRSVKERLTDDDGWKKTREYCS